MPPKIIGISGTNGSGKDSVGKMLAQYHNFLFVSVTDILRQDLIDRGLPTVRENTRALSAQWRRESGLGVLIDKAKAIYDSKKGKYVGLAMASLRNPGEVDSVHKYGGIVLWLDADPKIRYERISSSQRGAERASEDNKTFAEFMADEEAEMHRPKGGDAAMLSMAEVKAKSDLFLTNNYDNLDELRQQLDRLLGF